MRINAGIRRRLAPLLENNRERIELLNSLLLSLPGTPVALLRRRDRDGRQHLSRRSQRRADADAVDAPIATPGSRAPTPRASSRRVVMDPVYGYQAVNVEAQERSPASLLNWMKRLIASAPAASRVRARRLHSCARRNRKCWRTCASSTARRSCCVANLSGTRSRRARPSRLRGTRAGGAAGTDTVPARGPGALCDLTRVERLLLVQAARIHRASGHRQAGARVHAEATRRSRRAAAARTRVDLRVRERDAADPGARLPAAASRDTALVRRESPGAAPGAHP